MKYNKAFQGEPFEVYVEYLKKIQNKLPKQLYDFISNLKRHDGGKESLHDSWLNEISIKVKRDKENHNLGTSIKIELLGPYHDRLFEVSFQNSYKYLIEGGEFVNCDLLTYEIYLENEKEEDLLVFNAEFADGKIIRIYAKEIYIKEIML